MNTNLKDRIAALRSGPKNKKDRIELERNLLAAKFLSEIQIHLENQQLTRKQFAKKMGVSGSFISQLFTADKTVSMEFLAKAQEELCIKFYVTSERQNQDTHIDTVLEKIIKIDSRKVEKEMDDEGFWIYINRTKPNYSENLPPVSDNQLAPVA